VYLELLRMMLLPEGLDARLMRAMVEAIKQHRLRREREELGRGDWAALKAEGLALRPSWRQQWPRPEDLKPAEGLVNVGGDGNDFAIFVASLLHAVGAKARPPPSPLAPPASALAPPASRCVTPAPRLASPRLASPHRDHSPRPTTTTAQPATHPASPHPHRRLPAQVRLSIGCAHDVPLPTAPAEGAPPWERAAYDAARMADPSEGPPATVCQLFAEVSLAHEPPRRQPYISRLQPYALEVAALRTSPSRSPPPHPTPNTRAPQPLLPSLRVTGAPRARTEQDGGVGAPGAAGQPVAWQGV